MEIELSSEFLACLDDYRRKSTLHKGFRSWRKYVVSNRRRYDTGCAALEHWSYHTIRKCFSSFKRQISLNNVQVPYSKGIYLVLLAASTFLPEKTFKSNACRMDKLLSLFKQVKAY